MRVTSKASGLGLEETEQHSGGHRMRRFHREQLGHIGLLTTETLLLASTIFRTASSAFFRITRPANPTLGWLKSYSLDLDAVKEAIGGADEVYHQRPMLMFASAPNIPARTWSRIPS